MGLRVRELILEVCRARDYEIILGHIRPDHVHLLLSLPPRAAPSRVMQLVKGKTSHHLLQEFRHMRKEFWGRHVWARGYFAASTANVTDEVVAKYIELQDAAPDDDEGFKVTE